MAQSAFQAGALAASLPIITVGEPIVGVALGVAVLDEQVRVGGAEWLLFGVLVAAMVAATAALAHSAATGQAARGPVGPGHPADRARHQQLAQQGHREEPLDPSVEEPDPRKASRRRRR